MAKQVRREVTLNIPIHPNMELVAAHTASIIAEIMDFEETHIDEIQLAIIETCINAFEHSNSEDNKVTVTYVLTDDDLELKITDHGVGFGMDKTEFLDGETRAEAMQKRGWGLEIIREMMDEVKIDSNDGGTTITMLKKRA
ncbi:ATP-binding protein [Candidatus Poribacteria bacterium]|nr:ATP-binding protein [Candidatus Poribacteria bacterium]